MYNKKFELIKSANFYGSQCDVYSDGSNIGMTSSQLGNCLGYADGARSINKIISRNKYLDNLEFSSVVKLTTVDGKEREVRLFTEDGIYEVTMLAKTEKAREFRTFVRNVIKSIRNNDFYGSANIEEIIAKTAAAVAIEVAKQFTNAMNTPKPEAVKRVAKKYKYKTPSKISTLSPEIKMQVDYMLASGRYSCQKVADFIIINAEMPISQMAVNRYKRNNFIYLERIKQYE